MVLVRQSVLALILSVTFCAQAWAANPDCERFKPKGGDTAWLFAQQMSEAIGCTELEFQYANAELTNLAYWLDTPGGEQSQILSAYYVVRTLSADRIQEASQGYVSSGYDARRLDSKKLEAEIVARKLSPESATKVRALFKKAQERTAWFLEGLKTFPAPGFDLKKLFTDLPEAAAVAWEKSYQEHKDLYDLGTSIENQMFAAKSSEVPVEIKGCEDMHKAFKQYLATTQKGKLPPEISQFLMSDPLAFEMVTALTECDGLRGFKVDAAAEYGLIQYGRVWRGPRTAANWAALAFGKDTEVAAGNSSPINTSPASVGGHLGLAQAKKIFEYNFSLRNDPSSAKVATMKKRADGWVDVTFKVDKWMEPQMECVDVKPLHFNHWGQNGQPVYDWKCHVSGYTEKKNEVEPQAFSQESVEGVKPGMLIKMQTGTQGKDPKVQAFPLEVSIPAKTKKDKPKLISFSGIPLQ